jgi:hypothetical protein
MISLPMRALWLATGNNIRLGGDMARRCFHIRIDANVVRPFERTGFKYELPRYALDHRHTIISSLLTMACAWIVAGRPRWSGTPLGSFGDWCKVAGGILQFAGASEFLKNQQGMYQTTADVEDNVGAWDGFVNAIFCEFGESEFSARELARRIEREISGLMDTLPPLLGAPLDSKNRSWVTTLGKSLSKQEGRIFEIGDGEFLKLTSRLDGYRKIKMYQLKIPK